MSVKNKVEPNHFHYSQKSSSQLKNGWSSDYAFFHRTVAPDL